MKIPESEKVREIPTTRLFNGLNGAEVRAIVLRQVEKALLTDVRLGQNLAFPRIQWSWRLDILAHPKEDPHMVFETAGEVRQVDENGDDLDVGDQGHRFQIVGGQSIEKAPDILREENDIDVPIARRGKAGPAFEARRRHVVTPEEYKRHGAAAMDPQRATSPLAENLDGMPSDPGAEAIARAERDNDLTSARKLRIAQRSRPHKIVESSPLAEAEDVESEGPLVIRGYDDPRGQRNMEPDNTYPSDPRNKSETQEFPGAMRGVRSATIVQGSPMQARAEEIWARTSARRQAGEDIRPPEWAPESIDPKSPGYVPDRDDRVQEGVDKTTEAAATIAPDPPEPPVRGSK